MHITPYGMVAPPYQPPPVSRASRCTMLARTAPGCGRERVKYTVLHLFCTAHDAAAPGICLVSIYFRAIFIICTC